MYGTTVISNNLWKASTSLIQMFSMHTTADLVGAGEWNPDSIDLNSKEFYLILINEYTEY